MTSSTLRSKHGARGAGLILALAALAFPCAAAGQGEVRAREVRAIQAGDVSVRINEQFLNAMLEAMLSLTDPPSFPLGSARRGGAGEDADPAQGASPCDGRIALAREVGGTRTAVRFRDKRIEAPVAFRGSYEAALVGCIRFEGWAATTLELFFDAERQAMLARVVVREVHLENIPTLLSGVITQMVQEVIDRRVNPVGLLRAEQLSARFSVTPGGGALRMRARGVRHEILPGELRLHITYEIVRAD